MSTRPEGEVESWEGIRTTTPTSIQPANQPTNHPGILHKTSPFTLVLATPLGCRRCFVMWASFVISLFTHSLSSRLRSTRRNKTSNWYRQLLAGALFSLLFSALCSLFSALCSMFSAHCSVLCYWNCSTCSYTYEQKKCTLCKRKVYLFIY